MTNGRMRYHLGPAKGQRCPFPDVEGERLTTPLGLAELRTAYPWFAPLYVAVEARVRRDVPKRHGGQLRHPDPTGWRWNPRR